MCNSCQTCDNHAQGYAPCEAHPKSARMENKGIRGEVMWLIVESKGHKKTGSQSG